MRSRACREGLSSHLRDRPLFSGSGFRTRTTQPGKLHWNGRRVDVRVVDDKLLVRAGDLQATSIDISRFDYAREIYGVTAALSATGRELLALLVQLRATGGRELFFIFNPEGVLVHEELLQQHRGPAPRVGLSAAGPPGGPQEIVLNRGVPIRYFVSARE